MRILQAFPASITGFLAVRRRGSAGTGAAAGDAATGPIARLIASTIQVITGAGLTLANLRRTSAAVGFCSSLDILTDAGAVAGRCDQIPRPYACGAFTHVNALRVLRVVRLTTVFAVAAFAPVTALVAGEACFFAGITLVAITLTIVANVRAVAEDAIVARVARSGDAAFARRRIALVFGARVAIVGAGFVTFKAGVAAPSA